MFQTIERHIRNRGDQVGMNLRRLFLVTACLFFFGSIARASCPDDWDCVVTDVLVRGPHGAGVGLLDNSDPEKGKDLHLSRNDPQEVKELSKTLPSICSGKIPGEWEKYCHKRLILQLAANGWCDQLGLHSKKKLDHEINKQERSICEGFEHSFKKNLQCEAEGLQFRSHCECLAGKTVHTSTPPNQGKKGYEWEGKFLTDCLSAGQNTLFMKGGPHSCAPEPAIRTQAPASPCLSSSQGGVDKAKDESMGLMALTEKIGGLEQEPLVPQQNLYSAENTVSIFPALEKYLEKNCVGKPLAGQEPPVEECLYREISKLSIASKSIGMSPSKAFDALFRSTGPKPPCKTVVTVVERMIADALKIDPKKPITPDDNIFKNVPSVQQLAITRMGGMLLRVPPFNPQSVLNSQAIIKLAPANVSSQLFQDRLLFSYINEQDHGKVTTFMRGNIGGLVEDAKSKKWGDDFLNHITTKIQGKKETIISDYQVLLAEVPDILNRFPPSDKIFFSKYRNHTLNFCLSRPEVQAQITEKCEDWANRKLSDALLLRWFLPSFQHDEKYKVFRQSFIRLANHTLEPNDDMERQEIQRVNHLEGEYLRRLEQVIPKLKEH